MRRFSLLTVLAALVLLSLFVTADHAARAQVIPVAYWQAASIGDAASLRFRSSASTYLNRTPTAAGDQKTWTWSGWVKRGTLASTARIISVSNLSNNDFTVEFTGDTIELWGYVSGAVQLDLITSATYRDPSAWYHIVVAIDTTQAIATNRAKLYVNGAQVTSFSTSTYPAQNTNFYWNAAVDSRMGIYQNGTSSRFDGYMAEVNFVDGQALTPASFGQNDAATGQWTPKAYGGSYGTNGFYLKFADTTNLGKDSSGQGNNWTPNNFSTTAGPTYDPMGDAPAMSGTGANSWGNYASWNPLHDGDETYAEGNLKLTTAQTQAWANGSIGVSSGKWYWEYTVTQTSGISHLGIAVMNGATLESALLARTYYSDGNKYQFTPTMSGGAYGASYTANDVIGVALDMDAGQVTFYKNGVSQGVAWTGLAGSTWTPFAGKAAIGNNFTVVLNAGQRAFAYTPPSGFKALNAYNLPDPVIVKPSDYFKAVTYTGNGSYLQVGSPPALSGGANIANSLRFRSSNSAYLSRTPTTTGSRQKFTYSTWFKLSKIPSANSFMPIYSTGSAGSNPTFMIGFNDGNNSGATTAARLSVLDITSSVVLGLASERIFIDNSVWNHVVVSVDTTQPLQSDRIKVFLNGVQISMTANTTYGSNVWPSQNALLDNNTSAYSALIGKLNYGSGYFDGYIADFHFIDGAQTDASSFGQFNGAGVWVPKAYTGTYGTNGFHLDFADASNTTAATLGKDTSGNTNNWTPNGFSVSAGAGNDSLADTPTSNYSVWNPIDKGDTGLALSSGNLDFTVSNAVSGLTRGTLAVSSGKWYWEITLNATPASLNIGISPTTAVTTGDASGSGGYCYGIDSASTGRLFASGTAGSSYGTGGTTGSVMMVAVDLDAGKIWYGKDGTWFGSGDPSAGTNQAQSIATGVAYAPVFGRDSSNATTASNTNFGQRPFAYTPPSGFKALNTYNIAATAFVPDLVMIKSRSAATDWAWYDSARGPTLDLASNTTASETAQSGGLLSFNAGGFNLGSLAKVNTSGATYVAYMFKREVTPGFDLVTYTGTGAAQNINHSLGVAPNMIIVKSTTSAAGGADWVVYHSSLGPTKNLRLQNTTAATAQTVMWNDTAPTPTVFSLGINNNVNGGSGQRHVAYLWAEVPGFSKFGSYTGNGSTDGPFVYTGFRPAVVMVKRTDTAGNWSIWDTARSPNNGVQNRLYSDAAAIEDVYASPNSYVDLVSNGFKIRTSGGDPITNAVGGTYIYAAFAETPLKYANGR